MFLTNLCIFYRNGIVYHVYRNSYGIILKERDYKRGEHRRKRADPNKYNHLPGEISRSGSLQSRFWQKFCFWVSQCGETDSLSRRRHLHLRHQQSRDRRSLCRQSQRVSTQIRFCTRNETTTTDE